MSIKRNIAVCGALLTLAASVATPALAAGEPSCALDARISALQETQKAPVQDYLQGVRKELVARKALLAEIYSCGNAEAHALQNTLQSIPLNDTAMVRTKQKLHNALDDVIKFYETQTSVIAQLGIGGTQDAAKNLKTWRASNFEPLVQETARLALWIKQQGIIDTAKNRFTQIKTTLQRLKLDDNEDVLPLLTQANEHLQAASTAHNAAKNILAEGMFSDQSLPFLKESLDALAAAYQNFFEISESVNKVLPR